DSSLVTQTHVVGNTIFFTRSMGSTTSLWRTDGTAAGTTLVKDLPSTVSGAITDARGLLYFALPTSGTTTNSLWRSDGTPDGTKQIFQGANDVFDLTPVGDDLYFLVFAFGGSQLWRTNGTTAAT